MRIVCISDTHGWHDRADVPEGDVLVHARDITRHGSLEDVRDDHPTGNALAPGARRVDQAIEFPLQTPKGVLSSSDCTLRADP